ncbi:Glycine cleavage system H protein, mitochondrial [Trichinella patagoniensis]|uniref:Glycine cleavage system H protein, mitochondrial n=1 Tax=Trichinella patagoniensis TaxID=990121 RepID=A0A0V0ZFB5_9BILA|nr:Glycine cleavage system H protein, mitochondrial [Trichinella patagoniensis]
MSLFFKNVLFGQSTSVLRKLAEASLFNATQRLWVSKSPSLANRKYTEKHEWVSVDNKIGTVGLTDYAQVNLFTLFQQMSTESDNFAFQEALAECGVVESVKAASDIYSPVSGTVAEVNQALEENPSLINKSCYDDGWLFKVEVTNESELDTLMDEDKYSAFLKSENVE